MNLTGAKSVFGKPFQCDDNLISRLRRLDVEIRQRWSIDNPNLEIQRQLYQQSRLDEVYHSNRIEGNRLTYDETRRVVEAGDAISGKPSIDQLEAKNLAATLDFAQEVAFDKDQPVTQSCLRQFHAILMRGIETDAGRYREVPVTIAQSSHTPPDPFLVPQLMTALSDYLLIITSLDAYTITSPVVSAAVAHTLFVQIHPFSDGNGRTARALMNLVLRRRSYPPSVIPADARSRYVNSLEAAWEDGDLTAFVELIKDRLHGF